MRVALVLLAVLAAPVAAQDPPDLPPNTEPRDVAIFRAVYGVESPLLVLPMRVVNDTAYPVFVGTAPALGLAALLGDADPDAAFRLAGAQALNTALTFAVKHLVQRPRPYAALDGIIARDRRHAREGIFDPHSFPSGHTSVATVIATSLSLSYPEWVVVVPAAAWAATMGAARIWHGVHYPTDVAVGAVIGVASAVLVHAVYDAVDADGAEAGAVRLVIAL